MTTTRDDLDVESVNRMLPFLRQFGTIQIGVIPRFRGPRAMTGVLKVAHEVLLDFVHPLQRRCRASICGHVSV